MERRNIVDMGRLNTYEKWLEKEGLPVFRDYSAAGLDTMPLKPWPRKGGLGAYLNLVGAEGVIDAYVCEIPPGGSLLPQRHVYEEVIYIMSGYGASTVWVEGSSKQTFEWQEGSLFSPPLNTWHQHFNTQSDKPVRYFAVTRAPIFMNLFHDEDFIFNNSYVFKGRYSGEKDYFASKAKTLAGRNVWESNFIPDCRKTALVGEPEGGMGPMSVAFYELSDNLMNVHIAEHEVGTYKKAHYHTPGAHLLCLEGEGYSLMWPVDAGIDADHGRARVKVDWHKYAVFSPPDRWFHQHFNTGKGPARMVAFHAEQSRKYTGTRKNWGIRGNVSIKDGGTQIEWQDEDPAVRRLFKQELAKTGAPYRMSQFFPGD
ncbi:MAG: cupin domain-containing protein [Chloroflexi bacterium]|nr:cupin domain-containing protein [Chloroflexota bacterium]